MIIDLRNIQQYREDNRLALIDKVERAGMGIPQAIDSWKNLLQVTPHYKVTYNPERTTVRLEVETLFDAENVHKNVHENVLKNVLKDDPKNDPKDDQKKSIEIQENNRGFECVDDPKDDPKNVLKNDPKNVHINVHKNVQENVTMELTDRQKSILLWVKDDGNITMEGLSQKLNVSLKTVKREMSQLQKMKKIERVGSKTNGEWKVL